MHNYCHDSNVVTPEIVHGVEQRGAFTFTATHPDIASIATPMVKVLPVGRRIGIFKGVMPKHDGADGVLALVHTDPSIIIVLYNELALYS